VHVMNVCGRVDVQTRSFLVSTFGGGQWLALCCAIFIPLPLSVGAWDSVVVKALRY
jgi:hypothetical protein